MEFAASGSELAVGAMGGGNQQMEELSLSLDHSAIQMSKNNNFSKKPDAKSSKNHKESKVTFLFPVNLGRISFLVLLKSIMISCFTVN